MLQRIRTISETLQKSLKASFSKGVEAKDVETLRQCLRTYAMIDKVDIVENIFRNMVVIPFVAKSINKDAVKANEIDKVYVVILDFIKERCHTLNQATLDTGIGSFDFMTNSVWPEVSEALSRLPSLFTSGIADDFRRNYNLAQSFIEKFEQQCLTINSVKRLRAHPSFMAFQKRWSLPVYAQLRFGEIAGGLENKLGEPRDLEWADPGGELLLPQSAKLVEMVRQCWSDQVYIHGLAHRFWKLTLQLIVRYGVWINELEFSDAELKGPSVIAMAILDGRAVVGRIDGLYSECVEPHVSHMGIDLSAVLEQSKSGLAKAADQAQTALVESVAAQCAPRLEAAKQISRQYRHTGKKAPTEASVYVAETLAPLRSVMEANAAGPTQAVIAELVRPALLNVVAKFASIMSEILVSVKKTQESLNRLKKRNVNKGGGPTDYDKIVGQLYLDAQGYAQHAEALAPGIKDEASILEMIKMADEARTFQAGAQAQ